MDSRRTSPAFARGFAGIEIERFLEIPRQRESRTACISTGIWTVGAASGLMIAVLISSWPASRSGDERGFELALELGQVAVPRVVGVAAPTSCAATLVQAGHHRGCVRRMIGLLERRNIERLEASPLPPSSDALEVESRNRRSTPRRSDRPRKVRASMRSAREPVSRPRPARPRRLAMTSVGADRAGLEMTSVGGSMKFDACSIISVGCSTCCVAVWAVCVGRSPIRLRSDSTVGSSRAASRGSATHGRRLVRAALRRIESEVQTRDCLQPRRFAGGGRVLVLLRDAMTQAARSPSGSPNRSMSTRFSPPSRLRSTSAPAPRPLPAALPANIGSSGQICLPMMTILSHSPGRCAVAGRLELSWPSAGTHPCCPRRNRSPAISAGDRAARARARARCAPNRPPGHKGRRPCGNRPPPADRPDPDSPRSRSIAYPRRT